MLRGLIARAAAVETRYIFFSGKGGVGKTTIAASTAVWLADHGLRTLLISIDLQPSLSDLFQQRISADETPVKGVAGLAAYSVEPATSLDRYRTKMADTLRVIDPQSMLLKQFGTDAEVECGAPQASVYELSYFLNHRGYDRIVFDTAPTGIHLEKILSQSKYAQAMTRQIRERQKEQRRSLALDSETSALQQLMQLDEQAIVTMRSAETVFIMVCTPEAMPLAEVARNIPILEQVYLIPVRGLVINRLIPPDACQGRRFWQQRSAMQRAYVERARTQFASKDIGQAHLMPEVTGLGVLRHIGTDLYGNGVSEETYAFAR